MLTDLRVVPYRGKFAVEWYEGGKRKRASLGTDVHSEIEPALRRFTAEHEAKNRPAVMTVGYVAALYQESLRGKASAQTFGHQWKALGPHFGSTPADAVTEGQCNKYVGARTAIGRSAWTVHSELGRLRSALKWAEKKRLIGRAPEITRPKEPPPRDKRLTRAEFERFLAACELPHVKLFATLAITTAARMGAILDLTWDRVDFARGLIYLTDPDQTAAAKRRATIPMNRTAEIALREAREGARGPSVIEWGGGRVLSVKKALWAAGKRAGLPWVTAHVFRHSAATWMIEDGVPLSEVSQWLGHSSVKVTEKIYARFSPNYLRGAARSLELDRVVLFGSNEPDTLNAGGTRRQQTASDRAGISSKSLDIPLGEKP
jgi:integrase